MQVYPISVVESQAVLPSLKKGGHFVEIELEPNAVARLVMKTTDNHRQVYEENDVAKICQIGKPRQSINVINWERLPWLLMLICTSIMIGYWTIDPADTGVTHWAYVASILVASGLFWLLVPTTGFWQNFVTVIVTLSPTDLKEKPPSMILRIPTVAYHRLYTAKLLRVS